MFLSVSNDFNEMFVFDKRVISLDRGVGGAWALEMYDYMESTDGYRDLREEEAGKSVLSCNMFEQNSQTYLSNLTLTSANNTHN